MQVEDNSSDVRGGVFGLGRWVLTGIKNFFAASWDYFKRSKATFSSMGYKLITSAQTDLLNLKDQLDKLWVIQNEHKQTTALYMAAMLGKFGFTFIIIGVSLIASLVKLTGGSCCLLLAGEWLGLVSRVPNIFKEIFLHTLKILQKGMKNIITNALDLCIKTTQKLGHYVGKFFNATLDFLRAFTSYLNSVWQMVLKGIAAASRIFVSVLKWIGNGLFNAWRFTLDFAAATYRVLEKCIKVIGRLATNVIRNLSSAVMHCFKGIGHIGLGTFTAGSIIAKGVALSVAALFIETGIASSLSGVAKAMFIFDESLAAGLGALMDGVYAGGNSFIKASKLLFGYDVTVPKTIPVQEVNNLVSPVAEISIEDQETESEASDNYSLDENSYFSRKFRDNMHYVNNGIASAGNQLLRSYQEERNRMIGSSVWSHIDDTEGFVSNPTFLMRNV